MVPATWGCSSSYNIARVFRVKSQPGVITMVTPLHPLLHDLNPPAAPSPSTLGPRNISESQAKSSQFQWKSLRSFVRLTSKCYSVEPATDITTMRTSRSRDPLPGSVDDVDLPWLPWLPRLPWVSSPFWKWRFPVFVHSYFRYYERPKEFYRLKSHYIYIYYIYDYVYIYRYTHYRSI